MREASWLQEELNRAKKQGLTVHIEGKPCQYQDPAKFYHLLEEPSYMLDYVSDENGKITGSGDTVLGADDLAGVVEILEAVRHLQEEKKSYRDVEVLFTVAEESYIKGAKAFDFGRVSSC